VKTAIWLSLLIAAATPAALAQPSTSVQPASGTSAKPTAKVKKPIKAAKPAKAQTGAGGADLLGSHNSNAPINVSADNFVGDLASKIGTYIGNVLVIQGDMRMRADQVKVNVAQGKPTRIEATGKVVVNAPNGTATGDTGIYELGPRTITMTGHVVLTKEKDVMRGTKLVMDLNTNLAHLYAQGMPGGRVQGMFTPPPQQAQAGATAKKPKAASADKTEPATPTRVQQTIDPSGTAAAPADQPK
jgi:lipopolysaccharide export system protein LptA